MNPKMNYYFKRVTQILAFVFILSYLQVNTVAQVEEDEIYELEAFEVYTSSQISAIEAKRSSDLIGSFLGTDAIGDLPDDTLADALTRLPGVNVVNGEEVSVRGLEGKLNSVRINGMDIPQAQSTISTSVGTDTRNFDVSSVPAEIVESISVIKSITPDLDGDSIGGIVDVQTASALALDERLIRYKAEYRYDEMGDESGYGFSLNYGEPISENVGVYFTVAYRNEDRRSWQTEHRQVEDPGTVPIPELERLDPRETFGNDERFVFTGSLDWQVSKDTRLFAKPYVKIRKRDSMRHRVRVRDLDEREGNSRPFNGSEGVWWFEDGNGNPLGTWVDLDGDGVLGSAGDNFVPEGAIADETGVILDDDNIVITPFKQSADMRIQRRLRERPDRENETYALQIGGETQTDSYLLEYALQLSHDTHSFSEIRSNWSQGSSDTDFQRFFYDATDPYYVKLDAFVVTQDEGHIPVDPRVNPFMAHERLDLSSIRFRREENEHTAWVGQVDFTKYDVMENWEIKAGLKIRANDRGSRPQLRDFSWEGDNNYTYDQQSAYFGPNMGTHDGLYSNIGPGLTSNDGMQAFFDETMVADSSNWERSPGTEFARLAARFYDVEERITAAYAMAKGSFGPLTIIGGVRVEQTDQELTWKASEVPLIDGAIPIDDVTTENDYINYFPSLVGIYRFGDENQYVLRGAISTSIARPDYDDLIPFDTVAVDNALVLAGDDDIEANLVGNPDLTEQTAVNYDISFEWYPNNNTSMSVGAFYKDLEDFLMPATTVRTVMVAIDPEDRDPEDPEFEESEIRSSFVVNGGERKIQGLEFSWNQTLNMLPDPLDGLGFVLNYTFIDGEQTEPIVEVVQGRVVETGEVREGQTLQGQPEHIINAQLFYEKGPFNLRLAYTWVDEIKNDVFDVDFETFQEARGQLDMSVQYHLNDDIRLFVDVVNLTEEEKTRIFQTTTAFPESVVNAKRRWVVGLRGSF